MDLQDRMTVEGAEGIDIDVALAGLGSRTGAALIDLILQTVAILGVAALASLFGDAGVAIVAVASFLIVLGYPVVAETFAGGQTVGKRALGLVVLKSDGTPVTFMASVVRNVARVVDILPGTYLVGAVAIFASKLNQRLGDMAAGTIVVHRARRPAEALHQRADQGAVPFGAVPGSNMEPVLSPEVVGWDVSAVTGEEVAAIRSFLQRRSTLDPTHRANLAQTLAFQILPKVAGVPLDGGPEYFLERIAAAKTG